MPHRQSAGKYCLRADRHVHRHPETSVHQRRIDAVIFWRYRSGLYTGISPFCRQPCFAVLSAFGVEWLSKRKICRKTLPLPYSGHWAWHWALCSFLSPDSAPTCPPISSATFSRLPGATSLYWEGFAVLLLILFFAVSPSHHLRGFDREFAARKVFQCRYSNMY